LSVLVLPAAGGNIARLVDRRTGRNWLWNNPHLPIQSDRSGDDYGRQLDSGGWDEVLLSVAPDELVVGGSRKISVPDHGDLVRRRWRLLDSDASACTIAVTGDLLRYELRRTVSLDPHRPVIEVGYSLTNNEPFPWPWYWCAHALIAVEPGARIGLPETQPFRIDSSTTETSPGEHTGHWPTLESKGFDPIDLADCFEPARGSRPFASKLFVESPKTGQVSVTAPDGNETLTMSWPADQLPWLGLWINNNGWSGCDSEPYRNLGLEPATVAFDSVSEAIENDVVPVIEPGETIGWSIRLEVTAQ
jgi:hypothetical protein